jgi:hypothetical protein
VKLLSNEGQELLAAINREGEVVGNKMGYRNSKRCQKTDRLNGMSKPCRAPKSEAEEAKCRQRAEDQGVWQKVAMIGFGREGEN